MLGTSSYAIPSSADKGPCAYLIPWSEWIGLLTVFVYPHNLIILCHSAVAGGKVAIPWRHVDQASGVSTCRRHWRKCCSELSTLCLPQHELE